MPEGRGARAAIMVAYLPAHDAVSLSVSRRSEIALDHRHELYGIKWLAEILRRSSYPSVRGREFLQRRTASRRLARRRWNNRQV